jgi:hypothetical protein
MDETGATHFLSVSLAANQPPQEAYWVMMGAAGVFIVYIMLLRPRMRRKDPLARSGSTLSQERQVEREMQHLLVELSRQITSQLDTRAAKLDALIREADERIAQLRAAASNGEVHSSLPTALSIPPAADIDPRHAEIYALADTGRDANQIAQQLARPRGEIELILALRSNR